MVLLAGSALDPELVPLVLFEGGDPVQPNKTQSVTAVTRQPAIRMSSPTPWIITDIPAT